MTKYFNLEQVYEPLPPSVQLVIFTSSSDGAPDNRAVIAPIGWIDDSHFLFSISYTASVIAVSIEGGEGGQKLVVDMSNESTSPTTLIYWQVRMDTLRTSKDPWNLTLDVNKDRAHTGTWIFIKSGVRKDEE